MGESGETCRASLTCPSLRLVRGKSHAKTCQSQFGCEHLNLASHKLFAPGQRKGEGPTQWAHVEFIKGDTSGEGQSILQGVQLIRFVGNDKVAPHKEGPHQEFQTETIDRLWFAHEKLDTEVPSSGGDLPSMRYLEHGIRSSMALDVLQRKPSEVVLLFLGPTIALS